MKPQEDFLQITDNKTKIKKFIEEIIIAPKTTLKYWSQITKQTPAIKLGYIGQHLASLITGVQGTGSGARGDDLADGSEVKSCNKIDQVDRCKNCRQRVMRYEEICPNCSSNDIERKDDSKWLFSVRSEEELQQYLTMKRIVLLLMDYPNFSNNDFNHICISVFEIYPQEERMKVFGELISNHYRNIYLPKLTDNAKTNPMNLHPFSYQFYMCNPINTFTCIIKNIETEPVVNIQNYILPNVERGANISSVKMPTTLLKSAEWNELLTNAPFEEVIPHLKSPLSKNEFVSLSNTDKEKVLPYIPENLRIYLSLRPITSVRQHTEYKRS